MTKIHTLLLLCLFALVLPVAGQEAEFKKIKESWTLRADGSQVYRHMKVLTLYTHTAIVTVLPPLILNVYFFSQYLAWFR